MRPEQGYRVASLEPKNKFGNDVAEAQLAIGLTKPTLANRVQCFRLFVVFRKSDGKRPVKSGAVHIEQVGDLTATIALINQLAGVFNLPRHQLSLAPEFHTSTARSLHAGACAFIDKAALKFGQGSMVPESHSYEESAPSWLRVKAAPKSGKPSTRD